MFDSFRSSLVSWNAATTDRQKLQQTYLVATAVTVLTAGIFALINYDLGHDILRVAGVLAGVYLINTVAWSLVQTGILTRITTPVTSKTRRK